MINNQETRDRISAALASLMGCSFETEAALEEAMLAAIRGVGNLSEAEQHLIRHRSLDLPPAD